MNKNDIIKFCKDLGCCDACCLRYLGLKNPSAYENAKEFVLKYLDTNAETNNDIKSSAVKKENENGADPSEDSNGSRGPPAKRSKTEDVCVSCLGVLQEDTWPQCCDMAKEMLDKKNYECETFACALSAPIASILRERAVTLRLQDEYKQYDIKTVTPLKEAWKWSFGVRLAARVGKPLDSGAVSPLLVTLNIDYPDEPQELEILKGLSPSLFESRGRQRRRFAVEFTRRSAEQALEGVSLDAFRALAAAGRPDWARAVPAVGAAVRCVSVVCTHAPLYLAGRYIKLSRELPQSPWLVGGARVMLSSVQEIICGPLAALYRMSTQEAESRLKFMSAGREDVDVRCLGDGRPFALEVTDPRRQLTAEELSRACDEISRDGAVLVKRLVHITKDDLVLLKKGEETKCKTYEALCIKLSHSADDQPGGDAPVAVTDRDIANINSYTNMPDAAPLGPGSGPLGPDSGSLGPDAARPRIALSQKTPIRVLHRRALLTRTRHILELSARRVPGHPQLLRVRVVTEAGTYVKEWVHGEARRTSPALGAALRARVDILALDVAAVHLAWPPPAADAMTA